MATTKELTKNLEAVMAKRPKHGARNSAWEDELKHVAFEAIGRVQVLEGKVGHLKLQNEELRREGLLAQEGLRRVSEKLRRMREK